MLKPRTRLRSEPPRSPNSSQTLQAKLDDICVVAPATEQSGIGHSITFLSPVVCKVCKQVFDGDRRCGWAVEGSPADCVKLGIFEHCPTQPEAEPGAGTKRSRAPKCTMGL
ncbi:MAG: hypothetical protein CMJ64_06995 [Planctomycetaceae bacterium]|nr:hypothetical protein [Planctomycetaceae bacterium]